MAGTKTPEMAINADSLLAHVQATLAEAGLATPAAAVAAAPAAPKQKAKPSPNTPAAAVVETPTPPEPPMVSATTPITPPADESIQFPEGTPDIVSSLLGSGLTTKQIVASLAKQVSEHPEIRTWAETPGKPGRVAASLQQYVDVKKLLREKLGVKPGIRTTPASSSAPSASTAAKNFEQAGNIASAMAAPAVAKTVLEALTPGDVPMTRFVNKRDQKVYLLWSDLLAGEVNGYQLRFRKFTYGDNTKPGTHRVPSVYLMKGEQVVANLSPDAFIALLGVINQMNGNGKLNEILQAIIALSK